MILGQDFLYIHKPCLTFEDTENHVSPKLTNGKSNNGKYKLRQAKKWNKWNFV